MFLLSAFCRSPLTCLPDSADRPAFGLLIRNSSVRQAQSSPYAPAQSSTLSAALIVVPLGQRAYFDNCTHMVRRLRRSTIKHSMHAGIHQMRD